MANLTSVLQSTGCIIIIMLLIWPAAVESKFKSYCPQTEGCICNINDNDFEYECPPDGQPIISLRVNNERIQIECRTPKSDVFTLLPKMNLGNMTTVGFKLCPTPDSGTTYQSILTRLGVSHTRTLRLHNNIGDINRHHFSGLNNVERLRLFKHDEQTELPENIFLDLRNLTWLQIQYTSIPSSAKLFSGLSNLDNLELGYNKISVLTPGMFQKQNKLKVLSLWGNDLKKIQKTQLEGLESLQELDLSSNDLETLDTGVFDNMTNLRLLHLSSNPLNSLPKGLLEHTKEMTHFKLADNRAIMETLPSGIFARLPMLNEVELECGLKSLPEDTFTHSVNMVNITLSNNNLKVLPESVFNGLTSLIKLDLSRNQLSDFEDGVFKSLISVEILDLSNNQLTEISEALLFNMTSLLELNVNGNHLHTIGTKSFRTNKNLMYLNLADNKLTFKSTSDGYDWTFSIGSSPFSNLERLSILNLRNNSLTSIISDWSIFNMNIKHLDLSYNFIQQFDVGTDIPKIAPSGLTLTVNLSHNALEVLDFDKVDTLFENKRQIRYNIYIDNNPINCDCNMLSFVKFLYQTHPRESDSNELSMFMGELKCVKPTELIGRRIKDVKTNELLCNIGNDLCPASCQCLARPADLAMIVNCTNIGLTHVPEISIPSQFGLNFTILNIEQNNIVALPFLNKDKNVSFGYEYVTEILADHNNISQIYEYNIPRNLRKLSVRYNHLTTLNETILNRFNSSENLKSISLGHNPWTCDCNAKHFLMFTQNHAGRLIDISKISCNGNDNIHKLVYEHSLSDLCPQDQMVIVMMSIIMLLLGLSAGILVAFYYKYQQEVKVWMYAHKILSCLVTEHEIDSNMKFDAFVSFSHKDHDFVVNLARELENGQTPYSLCLHERDWLVGNAITDSIAESVASSRRTIIVLTQNFVESVWSKMEFRVAHKKSLSENRARLIVIVCGELQDMNIDSLDEEMKAYLQTNTYIKWGDPWFWKKLRYAMPHREYTHTLDKKGQHLHMHYQNNDVLHRTKALKPDPVDDKRDLINPQSPTRTTTPPAELAGQKFANALNGPFNGHVNSAFIINSNAKQSDV